MSTHEWYRRTTWTDADREAFNAQLARSRQKPQYLRIQAAHLADAQLWDAAIELLTRLIAEFPDDEQMAQVQLQLAEAYVQVGQPDLALRAFEASMAAQRSNPNVRTQAWLLYPWFIVEQQLSKLYEVAREVLDEFAEERYLSLPIERYRYNACRALLSENRGNWKRRRRTQPKQWLLVARRTLVSGTIQKLVSSVQQTTRSMIALFQFTRNE